MSGIPFFLDVPDESDIRPLPLIVAERWNFPLAYTETKDGLYYAIQDWARGLTGDSDIRKVLSKMQKQMSISSRPLPYVATDGKTYQREYTNDRGLYLIAQYLRVTKARVILGEIKRYLASAGVFVDEARRNPEAAAEELDRVAYSRQYKKLIAEGFSPEEAQEWLDVRHKQKRQRRIITGIWRERGISKPTDFAELTNQIHRVALGRTATRHKRELAVKDSPRNHISAANNATIQITEFTSALLHEHRESVGKTELSEDIDDVQPIIDAARPEIEKVFSKKPRRLQSPNRSELPPR